jgi:plasmid stabilization system protein ParE
VAQVTYTGNALDNLQHAFEFLAWEDASAAALYRHLPRRDEIRVLAVRHQRELDYP